MNTGLDETFYVEKMQEAITRFLSPWAAFPGGGSPSFGGKVYKSVLINFVEDLPYVDYVTDFQLFHSFNGFHGNPQTMKRMRLRDRGHFPSWFLPENMLLTQLTPSWRKRRGEMSV
ncbi:MAG: hypothetical protein U0586_14780 [Candidatus Brocadiaceae bacterium]